MKGLKKLLSLVLAVAMVATLAPSVPAKAAGELDGQIVILHTNDVHGQMEGGGYQKIAAFKKNLEAKGAEVLLFDAGDFSQGSKYVIDSKGKSAVEMMNLAGYTAATMGNHEVDYGLDNLLSIRKDMKFDFLVSSLKMDGKLLFDGGKIYELKSGVKVGVFGLNTPETKTKTNPKNYEGKNVEFASGKELTDIAKAEVKSLKEKGADIIVCLSHLGIDSESAANKNRSIDVFKDVEGVDIVIDGHSHSSLEDMVKATKEAGINNTIITSTQSGLKNVGIVYGSKENGVFKFEAAGMSTEEIEVIDETVAQYYDKLKSEVDSVYDVKIAESEVTLPSEKSDVRTGEAAIGNLVTDAMVWAGKDLGLDVDMAITNGGGLRKTIEKGDITLGNLIELLPYFNTLAYVEIKGKYILEALEASTYSYPESLGGFPQASGIVFTIDPNGKYDAGDNYPGSEYKKPNSINRVSIKSINGKAFDPEKVYKIMVNDFMYGGGDTYYVLKPYAERSFDTGTSLHVIVLDYITKELNGVIPASKYAKVAGNITAIVEETEAEPTPAPAVPVGSYVVKKGDNLWKIAKATYGDGNKYRAIFDANTNILKDPNKIQVGQVLVLPAA